ncbi:hypothetical protein B4135_1692 [Caldibacillus debilis]|uniref:Uncharacterized protein n=1 Tax=Caldibacillus debilis TaxID=301148 RepID=A0A150M9Y5_9BACI|nr:hypothetical protein B4135_1692 [Caldibacillus debilis]
MKMAHFFEIPFLHNFTDLTFKSPLFDLFSLEKIWMGHN